MVPGSDGVSGAVLWLLAVLGESLRVQRIIKCRGKFKFKGVSRLADGFPRFRDTICQPYYTSPKLKVDVFRD